MRLRLRCLVESAPRANRHWTGEELLSRCLTAWHGWERRRERYESIAQSLVGGLVVAAISFGLSVMTMVL